ncbi:MAG: hypothetical protein IJD45_08085 [Clostridia bacterium]|nr:hypothetical protein [Clostridia bacterium]
MLTKSLLQNWFLREEPLNITAKDYGSVLQKADNWMEVKSLPCDVHMPLIECGRIEEPLIADNSFKCDWIEQRSWWFRKSFTLEKEDLSPFGVELFIEMLDIHADLFLNGNYIGHHASAMYPFQKNVLPWLQEGENTLLIRLTTGLDQVSDEDAAPVRDFVSCEWRTRREGRGDDRRTMLRKPQYVFGWDQSPRLATCAIAGKVCLNIFDEIVVRDIRFETLSIKDNVADILAEVEVESRERLYARDCNVTFTIEKDGKVIHTDSRRFVGQIGANYIDFSFTLENPELWWPNGYGDQPLYTVRATACNNYGAKDSKEIITGIRTVSLDTSMINETEGNYRFIVNNTPIYCRGADFIHSDCLYARITDELQNKLLTAAKKGNFCMVRFWDGNIYQTDYVYELCDRYGLLVIQNFCFACAVYPDHLESFRKEVEKEAIYQLCRLRNHPSLCLWVGNGECHANLSDFMDRSYFDEYNSVLYPGGTYLFGQLLPRLHHALVASVGYQCATPFGGYDDLESTVRGSRHYYPFLDLSPEKQQYRISTKSFDDLECRFITEGGVMGPPSAEALISYCDGRENITPKSKIFEHHRNTFERGAVCDGIYNHYTGEKELTLEEYCLYGGLFQGSMLSYEAEHIRLQAYCGGSLLWCLNDGFGEVGFSMMDHYGNPKPAYYFLRRSYASCRVILKQKDGELLVYCTNSSLTDKKVDITCGYTDFEGNTDGEIYFTAVLPAGAPATCIGTMPIGKYDLTRGIVYAKSSDKEILTATLRADNFSTLKLPRKAKLTISDFEKIGNALSFTVSSDCFAHAVHFGLKADKFFSDQYFDLLPGETRRITLENAQDITPDDLKPDCVFIER